MQIRFRPEETDGRSGVDHVFIPLLKGHQDVDHGGGFHHFALVNLESKGRTALRTGRVDRAFLCLERRDHAEGIPSAVGPIAFAVNFGHKRGRHGGKGVGNANVGGTGVEKEGMDLMQGKQQVNCRFMLQPKVLLNVGEMRGVGGCRKVLIDEGADGPKKWVFCWYSHRSIWGESTMIAKFDVTL